MRQLPSIAAFIISLLVILPSTTATSSIAFSTIAALPTTAAVGNFPVPAIPVNNYYYRNSSNGPNGEAFQDYLRSLHSSTWTFSLNIFLTADGTSSTSTIHISGPAHEIPDLTPSIVAAENQTTYWDVCFLYTPDILTNYDASHPNSDGPGTTRFNGSFFDILGLDCGNDLAAQFSDQLFYNFTTACGGPDGTGNKWSFPVPQNCSSLVGSAANGNLTSMFRPRPFLFSILTFSFAQTLNSRPIKANTALAYSTPRVFGTSPFFVRTDKYTPPINASLIAAKQRTFPIMWVERSRVGEISLDGQVCLRAINGSDGTALKNGTVGAYSGIRLAWVWGVVMLVMAATVL